VVSNKLRKWSITWFFIWGSEQLFFNNSPCVYKASKNHGKLMEIDPSTTIVNLTKVGHYNY